MNPCESYESLLDAFAEGDLFTDDMIHVQQHLMQCPNCMAYVDDLLAMRAAFPKVTDTPVPADFTASVMAAVAAAPQAQVPAQKKRHSSPMRVLAPLAACCAIVLAAKTGPVLQNGSYAAETAPSFFATTEDCAAVAEEAAETEADMEAYIYTSESADADAKAKACPTADSCEPAEVTGSSNISVSLTDGAEAEEIDSWVEHENVVFSCVVYLHPEEIGTLLDGFEGKPFSNSQLPEKGIIGTGYALKQAEFERILYDELGYLHGPMLNQEHTTDLCCIVVTDNPAFS